MTLTLRPIRIKVISITGIDQAEDQKEVSYDMTETPRAIVSDIIQTLHAGNPLTEANGVCLGEPYRPVAVEAESVLCWPSDDTSDDPFLNDLEAASTFQIYAYITLSILFLALMGIIALVAWPFVRLKDKLTGK